MKLEKRAPHLVLSILKGQQPFEGRAVTIELDDYVPVELDLPPSQFSVIHILATEMLHDKSDHVTERLRGFRPTTKVALYYRDLLNNRFPPSTQFITSRVMHIRRAIQGGIVAFATTNQIRFAREFKSIQNERGYGYRIGELTTSIVDLNDVLVIRDRVP